MRKTALVEITNLKAKGAFSAPFQIGSQQTLCHLVLDSGSSTLVVDEQYFDPKNDKHSRYTPLVQEVFYGAGGWFGPVIQTQVVVGHGQHEIRSDETNLAVCSIELADTFADAHGILGLAYTELNHAFDISALCKDASGEIGSNNNSQWFELANQLGDGLTEIRSRLQHLPKENVKPYLKQLEDHKQIRHQFAFLVHRSSIFHCEEADHTDSHPLNTGLFVVGSPKTHHYLHEQQYQAVPVLHDKYYNVQVKGIKIAHQPMIPAPELTVEQLPLHVSNGIIDTGATFIVLPKSLFQQVIAALVAYNVEFADHLKAFGAYQGKEFGIPLSKLDLSAWPDIHLLLQGFDDKTVQLTLTPQVYWQTHAPQANLATFKFTYLPNWPNQCVLGLPIFCDHYTIFDRAEHQTGAVIFAPKSVSSKTWHALQHSTEHITALFTEVGYLL